MTEPLVGFESSTYSQHGEDGVIAEVLRRIGQGTELDKWCVEVGAWDGVLWSNTARLIREDDYSAVLIEGDQQRAAALPGAHPGHTVVGVGAFVGFEDDERLDAILTSTPAPTTFDLLSIDVDGCDFHIWEAVREYRPKVVVIEYNPAIPNSVEFVQARDPSVHHGTSAAALIELAHNKEYTLAAVVACNLILVADEYAHIVLGSARPTLADLRDDSESIRYIFPGYDGTLFTSAPVTLPWHWDLPVSQSRLQAIPAPMRVYRGGFGPSDKAARMIGSFASAPRSTTRLVLHELRSRLDSR
jgi:hypothetical protein